MVAGNAEERLCPRRRELERREPERGRGQFGMSELPDVGRDGELRRDDPLPNSFEVIGPRPEGARHSLGEPPREIRDPLRLDPRQLTFEVLYVMPGEIAPEFPRRVPASVLVLVKEDAEELADLRPESRSLPFGNERSVLDEEEAGMEPRQRPAPAPCPSPDGRPELILRQRSGPAAQDTAHSQRAVERKVSEPSVIRIARLHEATR